MAEINESINKKNIITVSRNKPVAFVVGAAGFLGSHLVDTLLEKEIQVIGIDDLTSSQKQNLSSATQNRNFHFVIESPDKFNLDLDRLDYIFIVTSGKYNMEKVLELFKKYNCRMLFVSSINLYEKNNDENLSWFREMESKIAKIVGVNNLNARVLRLGPIFGPRMDFKQKDPLLKLIQQVLANELQKQVSLDFSSRALFIADAVDLIIRTIFAGNTAQKIFDGVATSPVKVSEIKQVLMDPVWYETRDFKFSELPPWPTPNLEKTIKILSWHPTHKLVASLRKTLTFFKDNEIAVPELKDEEIKKEGSEENNWDKDKKQALEAFKKDNKGVKKEVKDNKGIRLPKFSLPLSKIYLFAVIALVTYALVWPCLVLGWGVFAFRYQLSEGLKNLQIGELDKSLNNIEQASAGVNETKSIFDSFEPIRRTGLLRDQFEAGDSLINLSQLSVSSARSSVLGIQALLQSIKAITGENTESPSGYFSYAQMELSAASEDISKAYALIKNDDLGRQLPSFANQTIASFSEKLALYSKLVGQAQSASILLPKLVALNGNKDYLVLLQNNMELRPAGGFIGSFAKVSFEGGKLKKLDVNDIYAIDGALSIHVEPPKEIKDDLGQKNWYLRDSNWEADFPTSARQAEWFYTKETGEKAEGVIALDVSAIEELLAAIGPLNLSDYNEKITAENLFAKAVSHAEMSFFPGSQAKKSFLTALTNGVFEKMFFLPQNNWPGIISALGKSIEEKHISIYLNDPKMFSYILSQNWTNVMPRQSDQNKNQDFLSLVEANMGANKVNYYLDRSYNLETVVGKMGEIKHRLRITYVNRSPSDTFPGGKYKNRMRIYLPFSSKLTKASWGETDITQSISSFVDYGRSGYSLLLELLPKEQKTLVLDYTVPINLEFKDGKADYRLDIIKQAGTLNDPLQWNISYPISYQLISNQTQTVGPQEQTISTDLSTDRSFQVEFSQ